LELDRELLETRGLGRKHKENSAKVEKCIMASVESERKKLYIIEPERNYLLINQLHRIVSRCWNISRSPSLYLLIITITDFSSLNNILIVF
jgi:hypothetical protein